MTGFAHSAMECPSHLPARLEANITQLQARRQEALVLTEIGRSGFLRKCDPNELALRDELLRATSQCNARVLMLNHSGSVHAEGWTTFFVLTADGACVTAIRLVEGAKAFTLVSAEDESTSGTVALNGETLHVTGFLRTNLNRDTVTVGIQLFDENHKPVVMTSIIASVVGTAAPRIMPTSPAPALRESPTWSRVDVAA